MARDAKPFELSPKPFVRHAPPLFFFAVLTVGWTWPLVLRLREAIPGDPGDNYSFLWYLWWMRHVLATPGLRFFHTDFLFAPFGASIAVNPHTALPSFVAATVLGRASIVTALNVLLLGYVFLNMAAMYALAYDVTGRTAGAVVAALIFGLSPYVAAHFPGHFELAAVWTLPTFAWCFRRACVRGSVGWAAGAGIAAVATAYTSYYYLVYEAFFAIVYVAARCSMPIAVERRPAIWTAPRRALLVAAALLAAFALWIATTGGGTAAIAGARVSATTPQGPLTIAWVLLLAWAACSWRIRQRQPDSGASEPIPTAAIATVVGVTIVGTAPLLWEGVQLMASGDYVTPTYFWRSAPRGVDLAAPLLGHPFHSTFGAISARAYAALGLDPVEAVGWLGVIPLVLLFMLRRQPYDDARERRAWRVVAVAFAVWAAGPFLTVGGFDTGVRLPVILARWIPFVANARMPGRAMVGVFLAIAILGAMAVRRLRPGTVAALAAVIVAELWAAPMHLTFLDAPQVYRTLATRPPGAVCEVPFGVGDGLSAGAGSQDRRALYYATIHEHPLVGGFLGRMPTDVDLRYDPMPVVGRLLQFADPHRQTAPHADQAAVSPCGYLVVNRAATSAEALAYIAALPAQRIASDDLRDLYELRNH